MGNIPVFLLYPIFNYDYDKIKNSWRESKMMFSVNEKMRVLDRILYRKGMTYDIKVYGFYDAQDDSWISIERYEKLLMEMYEDGLIEIGNLINAIDRSTGIPDYRRTHIKALNDGIKFYEDHMTNSAIGFC